MLARRNLELDRSPHRATTYTEPSLPAGPYTVRTVAYWGVRWTAGGQSDVINVPVAATEQLPVGELQSVIAG